MANSRRSRPAADVTVAYAADERGNGIAYAVVHTGISPGVVRLAFRALPRPALEGREQGYAAVAALAAHLKDRGFARVRIRLSDSRLADELNGTGSPPKSLAMAYVRVRCLLHALGSVRLEVWQSAELRDLAARAQAEVRLHVAA